MNFKAMALMAALVTGPSAELIADDLSVITPEVASKLAKGKRLKLVWATPGFDGTKGVRLGKISNISEDNASIAIEYFPITLGKISQKDSPYTLKIAIIAQKMKTTMGGGSSGMVEAEGVILEGAGRVVAAFRSYSTKTAGGNERDNVRLAVRDISTALLSDLFPSAAPSFEKSPALIVPGSKPSHPAPTKPTVLIPAPAYQAPATSPGAPSHEPVPGASAQTPAAPADTAGAPLAAPSHTAASTPASAATRKPERTPLIPTAVMADLKRGKLFNRFWISPAYEKAKGFSIGEVKYQVESRNDGIDKYLPDALKQIETPGASCWLNLNITELQVRSFSNGTSKTSLGVDGLLVREDGTPLAAFQTREESVGTGDVVEDGRNAARKMILAISESFND